MSDSPVYFGVEIGGTKLQVIAVSRDGEVLGERRMNVRCGDDAAAIRAAVVKELKAMRQLWQPAAIGVGFGGPVDWNTGIVARCFQVDGWTGFPLGEWLSGELDGMPVVIENDAKAAAFAEANHGAGRGHSLVLYSNSGSGVGAGFVIDGEIYHGQSPGEMELGHVRLDLTGRTVEDGASGWSLDRRVRHQALSAPGGRLAGLVKLTPANGGEARVLTEALASGDAAAEGILNETARDYAHGLSHAVHLLHPEIIILGGGVSLLGEPWRKAVARHLAEFLMAAFRPGPPLVLAELGERVVPVGAAMLAKRRAHSRPRPPRAPSVLAHWMQEYLEAQHRVLDRVQIAALVPIVDTLRQANLAHRRIFVCGNGGNAANASHFVTDLGKNASAATPRPFHVLSINDNMSWVTAIGNDFAYEEVFVRQLANHAQAGDVLITSSVSGDSPNVVRALEWSRANGLDTVALVGARRGRAAELADHVVVIDDTHYGRVEDGQMQILHMLCYAFAEKAVTF